RGPPPGDELIAVVVSPKRCPRTSCELRVDERQLGADHLERFDAERRPRAAIEHAQRRRLRSRRDHDRHRSRAYPSVSRGHTATTSAWRWAPPGSKLFGISQKRKTPLSRVSV